MADLDTTSKRRSHARLLQPYSTALPEPTLVLGDIDQADRQHLVWLYSGVLAAGADAGQPTMRRWGGVPGMTFTGRRSW